VVNGFFSFLPSLNLIAVNNEALGWTGFTGGTIFLFGGFLMILESLNRKQVVCSPILGELIEKVCFGSACRDLYDRCTHHFHNYDRKLSEDDVDSHLQDWIWFGARWHEIGFVASAIQCLAATIFWIATVTGIPGVIDMNNIRLTNGIFWVPQVIGGTGFIISRFPPPFPRPQLP
jgi:hypothetical protein